MQDIKTEKLVLLWITLQYKFLWTRKVFSPLFWLQIILAFQLHLILTFWEGHLTYGCVFWWLLFEPTNWPSHNRLYYVLHNMTLKMQCLTVNCFSALCASASRYNILAPTEIYCTYTPLAYYLMVICSGFKARRFSHLDVNLKDEPSTILSKILVSLVFNLSFLDTK